VIEKILAAHERVPETWPVHGTTGYRFMNVVNGLFVDSAVRTRFDRLYASFIGEPRLRRRAASLQDADYRPRAGERSQPVGHRADANRQARLAHLRLHPQRDPAGAGGDRRASRLPDLRDQNRITAEDRRHIDWAVAVAKRASTADETSVADFVATTLRGDAWPSDPEVAAAVQEFVERFQQFTAPVMAKGMEDTSFYIFNRLHVVERSRRRSANIRLYCVGVSRRVGRACQDGAPHDVGHVDTRQ
jgi:(1->4)-alpha-D-glucan 1-alpha-D-glucosylmutase